MMATFEVEMGGKTFEVEAPDQASALAAIQQFKPVQQPGVAMDVAKSAGVGVAKGVIGLAGLPGDAARGLAYLRDEYLVNPIARKLGIAELPKVATDPAKVVGSENIQRNVENLTGEFYKPKTMVGEYAQTIGEFAPGALIPGGAVTRAANVLAPAAVSETAGQVTKGSSMEPLARMAGALVGGVAGARGISPAAATPERAALAQILQNEGVPLTAGQRTGNRPLQWFEAAAADTPIAAGRAAAMNEEQGRAFTGAVLRRMGMSGDEIATPQAMNAGVQNLSNQFEALSARNTLRPDQQFVGDLTRTAQDYVSTVIPSQRAAGRQNIEAIMRDVVDVIQQNGGQMPGQLYQATRSRLSTMAEGARQNDPQLATAIRGIRNSLDDAMERSISPQDAAQWREVRQQWGNWKQIEKAVSGAGSQTAEGFISPSQLRGAVAGNNRGAYARGQGDMAELARAGEALLRPLPQSGTAPRQAASNMFASMLGGGAGAAAGGPLGAIAGAAAPALAGRALLSRPMQAYLGNQAAPVNADQMRRALLAELLIAHQHGYDGLGSGGIPRRQ